MHAWLETPGNVHWGDTFERRVNNAMKAVLPAERHRKIDNYSKAVLVMNRIEAAATRMPNPTARQATQVPFISPTAPLAPAPQQSMPTVLVNRGSNVVVNLNPGKYILEVF